MHSQRVFMSRRALLAMRRAGERLRQCWPELDEDVREELLRLFAEVEQRLRAATSDGERVGIAIDFLQRLEEMPAVAPLVRDILEAAKGPRLRERVTVDARMLDTILEMLAEARAAGEEAIRKGKGVEMPAAPPPMVPKMVPSPAPGLEEIAAQPLVVERYTDVDFPQQVRLGQQRVPLTVNLTQKPVEWSLATTLVTVALPTGEPEEALVILRAQDFEEVTGETMRSLIVYPDRDSDPVVFFLRPLSTGSKRVVLDFYHRNRNVGSVSFTTQVVEAEEAVAGWPVSVEPLAVRTSPPDAQPPDLELRVTLSDDQRTLSFMLHSVHGGVGYHFTPAGSVRLQSPPREHLGFLFDELSMLARQRLEEHSALEQEQIRERLQTIGQNLYRDLFSPQLKRAYRQWRANPLVRSILITSDEPWIPWEMVKPYDDSDLAEIIDDPFLCERFQVSRWLAGQGLPDSVLVASATLVLPESGLAHVKQEEEYFQGLAQRGIAVRTPFPQLLSEVGGLLEQGAVSLWHFACHGNFNSERPEESSVELADGELRPSDIVGPRATGVKLSKPLVFLNACHTSQLGFALTGLGGWAERFVKAGASGFVGSAWEVHDELAAAFAVRFYEELWGGASLGEALHRARLHIKQLDETNPTWLAYTLYGDPMGKARVAASR
ncbi:MAG: CHAT domain-containing protein [Anaerolineae bacterium]|nr:CHAT domain-containing protein [Anaerolineae bacterium]